MLDGCYALSMPVFHAAFVTGASSGLGRASARLLASHGTRVVLAARRAVELDDEVRAIRARGGQAEACVLDVADTAAVRRAVAAWDRRTGGLDLVLANAGIGRARPVQTLEWDELESVFAVNTTGAIATLWSGMGPMLERGRGTLAAVSSVAGMRGLPGSGSYSASKAALSTFLETMRADLAQTGVRVLDIRPGFVRTPMTDGAAHAMPFLLEVEDAARRCVRALERGRPLTVFPFGMNVAMTVVRHLPDAIWRRLAPRLRPPVAGR